MVWKPTPPVERRDVIRSLFASTSFRVLLAFTILITAGASAVTFWLFDNTPPYVYDAADSRIIPPVNHAEQPATAEWKVKVNRVCMGTLHRILFDPISGAQYTSYDAVLVADASMIRDGYLRRTFILPNGAILPKGKVGYRSIGKYSCNFLQRFFPLVVTTPDIFFEIE